MVHICHGIRFSHRKDELFPFVTTWRDLESIMLHEISQMGKDKNHHAFTDMWDMKQKTNKQNKQMNKLIDTENRRRVGRG